MIVNNLIKNLEAFLVQRKQKQLSELFEMTKDIVVQGFRQTQKSIIFKSLRGGGCAMGVQAENIQSIRQRNQSLSTSLNFPKNFRTDLKDCLNNLVQGAQLIGDIVQKNSILMKIQWFIHNREYLNFMCEDKLATTNSYELIEENFKSLLTVLTSYLRGSGFICHQILQICNELLRILFAFQLNNPKRFFKEATKQDYLQNITEFNTQLDIEQANFWKTGIEFEITIMKIMIMNSKTNSVEGNQILIDIFKLAADSIVDLFQKIYDGVKYLLKKGVEKMLYPKQTYQTYYLFQLMKWQIIRSLKTNQLVQKQIQILKEIFKIYILESSNWIIHFSWIQMITDIIAYRPIINKSILFKDLPLNEWNQLIENNLIRCVSYNKNEAMVTLFQDEQEHLQNSELNKLLQCCGKQIFQPFSLFLLKGDLIQNLNLWDFYKDFRFKNQTEQKQADYEVILANYEQEILKKFFNNLQSEKDAIISINSEILYQFHNYFQDSSLKHLFQGDQKPLLKQFLKSYKKMNIITNHIQELSKFEIAKLKLLTPYTEKFNNKVDFLDLSLFNHNQKIFQVHNQTTSQMLLNFIVPFTKLTYFWKLNQKKFIIKYHVFLIQMIFNLSSKLLKNNLINLTQTQLKESQITASLNNGNI